MRILKVALLASVFLSGCAVQQVNLDAFYAHRPRSIVVVPVLNESPEVSAPSVFITTISRPLAERGYYVFPVYLTDMILRDFGLTEAGHIHQLPPNRFYELFGADAVLFVTIKDWSTKYLVLASTVDVRMEYVLKDTKTGIELWRNEQTYSHGSGGAEFGLIGMAVSAAVNALVTDYTPLARIANQVVLMPPRGLPAGQYSQNYQATGNNKVTLKQLPSQKKSPITSPVITTENNISENKTAAPMAFTTKAVEKPKTTSATVINSKLIEKIQTALTSDHYYHGAISGELNEDTRNAIAVYKEINNLSGKSIDKAFLNALGIE
jgi:hypothetical protein